MTDALVLDTVACKLSFLDLERFLAILIGNVPVPPNPPASNTNIEFELPGIPKGDLSKNPPFALERFQALAWSQRTPNAPRSHESSDS